LSKVCLSGDRRVKACLTALKQEKKKKKAEAKKHRASIFLCGEVYSFYEHFMTLASALHLATWRSIHAKHK